MAKEENDETIAPFATESSDETYDLDDIGNVKDEWASLTIYLPEELQNAVELAYREVSYDCKRVNNYDVQKLQDFYPLLIAMGLNNLDRSDPENVLTLLEYIQNEYV